MVWEVIVLDISRARYGASVQRNRGKERRMYKICIRHIIAEKLVVVVEMTVSSDAIWRWLAVRRGSPSI
jgi:hypothetical protein